MDIYTSLADFPQSDNGCVLTVGNFDGVHLGHQKIIAHARDLARREHLRLVAFTFNPAPVQILRPDVAPGLLTPLPVKIKLLAEQDIDGLLVIEPEPEILKLSAEEFAQQILVERLGVKHIVEGQTFAFGRRREGTMISLKELGQRYGFQAHLVSACKLALEDNQLQAVSSTLVRHHFSLCEFELVRRCLGRYLGLPGQIVHGRGQGRHLGFPTANLRCYDAKQIVCEDGVFAGFARIGRDLDAAWASRQLIPAAIAIGKPMSVTDGAWQIEAHLLDFDQPGDAIYDWHMLLAPVERLRKQEAYDTPEKLQAAIARDCIAVREVLKQKGELL